jgi:hypothetical protein
MPYHVKIRRKNTHGKPGAVMGTFGPFTTKAKAVEQGEVLADQCTAGHCVTVEPVKKRKRNTHRRNGARGYMTKAEFTSFFRAEVWPSIKDLDPTTRRTTWNDMVDSFQKDGQISPSADWTRPAWVGAHRKRNTTSRARFPAFAGHRANPSRKYKGHTITGTTGHYVVQPYDKAFRTLKAAKQWLDGHVKRESRMNPRVYRRP